jgi:hypothetical protein
MILSHGIDGILFTVLGVAMLVIGRKRLLASRAAEKDERPKDKGAPSLLIIGALLACHGVYHLIRAFS